MVLCDAIDKVTHEDEIMLKMMDHIRRGMPNSGLEPDKSMMEYHRNTRRLQRRPMGTPVAIQNQSGHYPTKWDKTGVIMEAGNLNRSRSRRMGAVD